jgi:hypothetical protein
VFFCLPVEFFTGVFAIFTHRPGAGQAQGGAGRADFRIESDLRARIPRNLP